MPRRVTDADGSVRYGPLKYGDFLYSGKRTYSAKRQYKPEIEELTDVIETDDHLISLEDSVRRLGTDLENGLREDQVLSAREKYGYNTVTDAKQNVFIDSFNRIRGCFYDVAAGIFLCLSTLFIVYAQLPSPYKYDNLFIGLLMIFAAVLTMSISIWQERKNMKLMKSFRQFYPEYASVIRDGKKVRIHTSEIVVGDLVLLKAGQKIPADIRIIQASKMQVDEFPLVYGKGSVKKSPQCTNNNPASSQNVAFYGSECVEGNGRGIVTYTGDRTAFGKMMKKMVVLQKMDTSVHKEIRRILCGLGVGSCVVGVLLMAVNTTFVLEHLWVVLLTIVLSQINTTMPNIICTIASACFYWSAKRMVSINCLPKDFEAVEKLGSITAICCNKTGTITQNRMTVVHLWLDGQVATVQPSADRQEMTLDIDSHRETRYAFSRAASLCSAIATKSRRERCVIRKGCSCDQSEVAIMEFVNSTAGLHSGMEIEDFAQNYVKVFEVQYTSYKNYHVTIHDTKHSLYEMCSYVLCMKGAVKDILKYCTSVLVDGENQPLSALNDLNFEKEFQQLMELGERIIGFCDYEIPKHNYPHMYEFEESDIPLSGYRFLGFIALLDPPRPSVPEAIKKCREAGIKVILATGDHPTTGKAIAKKVGIISGNSKTKEEIMELYNITEKDAAPERATAIIMSGSELESMKMQDLKDLLNNYEEFVFGRLNATQKIKLVEGLKRNNKFVAVTGNSGEHAKAMRKADIAVGMGMHGSQISRDVADVILLGDNFDSILHAIEEGRVVYDNLQKAMLYVLSSNAPAITPLLIVGILQLPFTLGATFIICITLIAETFPVLAIARSPADGNILARPNIGRHNFFDRRIFNKSHGQIGVMCILSGALVYFLIMAQHGFLPRHIIGIARAWDSPAVNDLLDSYNQEWDYASRKSLEYTCQTGFFLAIIVMQFFHFVLITKPIYKRTRMFRLQFLYTVVCNPLAQIKAILFLMYVPGLSIALHFYPLKITDWLLLLPFPCVFLLYEGIQRHILRNSAGDSFFEKERV